jgi:histone-lysine N-methyltransferase SETD2
MLKELNLHKELYKKVFVSERRFNYIKDALHPPKRRVLPGHVAPIEKWLTFPDMGHILATHYNKVIVELTAPGDRVSETFFPLRGSPPSDPAKNILCLGLVPGHFVLVKLKEGCPLPRHAHASSGGIIGPKKPLHGSIRSWNVRALLPNFWKRR